MRKISLTINRLIALLLVFILGFMSCIGAIVGVGYIAYSRVSIDWLEELGILNINDEDYLDAKAEVSLSAMTIQGLIAELQTLSSLDKDITIEMLLTRYGLTLSEEAEELLPDGIKTVSLDKLFSGDGISYVLENTKVEYIFKFVPEDTISEPAREILKNKTFADVVRLDLGYLLDGVRIGYFLGVDYEKDIDGEFRVVYKDPAAPTLFELIAPLQIGSVLKTFTQGGDLLALLEADLGEVMIESLVGSVVDFDTLSIKGLLEGKAISDILVLNEETGNYSLKITNLLNGKTIADLLEYDPIIENGITVGYKDKNGQAVVGLMRGLGSATLEGIGDDGFKLTSILEDLYLGDLLEYNPVYDFESGEIVAWNNSRGEEVGALEGKLAAKTFGEVMGDDFEAANILDGMFVGDILGHEALYEDILDPTKITGWKDENGDNVTGLDNAIANIDLGKMLSDSDYEVTSVLDGVFLGEIMGDTAILDGDGNVIGWQDESETELKGIDKAVANIDIGRLVNDSTYKIEDAFNDLYIGEMLGYEKGDQLPPEDPSDPEELVKYKWYEIDDTDPNNPIRTEVEGINAKLSNYILGRIISGDEELSADEIAGDMTIAEVLGIDSKELYVTSNGTDLLVDEFDNPLTVTVWYESETVRANGIVSSIAGLSVNEFDSKLDEIYVGSAIGLIEINGEWVDTEENTVFIDSYECLVTKKAEGLICHMADLTIDDLNNSDMVDTTIQGIYVGEVLGHKPVYDGDGNIVDWLDGETDEKLTGFISIIALRKVGDIDNTILDELTIAEVMGYERHCKIHTVPGDHCPDGCENDAIWYKDNNGSLEKVDGVMSAIAGYTVSSLDKELNNLYLGDVMGYCFECTHCDSSDTETWCEECRTNLDDEGTPHCKGNCSGGKWYDDEGYEVEGVMASFINLTVDDMSDNDKVTSAIQTVKIRDAMGYKYETRCSEHGVNVCTSDDCTLGVYGLYDKNGNLVKGFMNSIADKQVSEMDGIMDELTVAEVMGYTYDEDTQAYYDGEIKPENEIVGIMGAVCDYEIGHLDDRLGHLYIGDVMDMYFWCSPCHNEDSSLWCDECKSNLDSEGKPICDHCSGGKWYKDRDHTEEAHGVMAAFARLTVNEMKDNAKITDAMRKVSVGEAMGYVQHCEHCQKVHDKTLDCNCATCVEPDCPLKWYDIGDSKLEAVTGIMKTIADSDIGHLNAKLDDTYIGDILNYRFDDPDVDGNDNDPELDTDENGWWYDGNDAKTTPLINTICTSKISTLSDTLNNLTIEHIFTEDEMESGFPMLLKMEHDKSPIKLTELASRSSNIVENTKMGQYKEAGLIIDDTTAAALKLIYGDDSWKELKLKEFVPSLISKAQSSS